MSPLRIVNVMLGRGLGGLEQALLDYQEALTRLGHDVHAVIHPEAAIRQALEARHAAWHALPQLGAWDVLAGMRLRRLLQRLRPSVCIAHGNRAMSMLQWAGAHPVVAVLPNYKMQCRGAAAVFHPTQDLRRYALDQGVAETRLHHIPSMVDVPPSPPARLRGDPPVIGAMGRFVAKKGFTTFIAALGRLRTEGVTFRAVLAGDGPDRAALEQLAAANGLNGTLAFPGWVDDKASFFGSIDLFCLPSLHEPFGIVLIEAMAHAKAIVASDSEGPAEILRDGHDGIIVPRGDPARLAAAIAALLGDPLYGAELAGSAHRRASDEFDTSRVGARIDAALRGVTQAGRNAPTAVQQTA